MKCYIINHKDSEMEDYLGSVGGNDDNFNFNDDVGFSELEQ